MPRAVADVVEDNYGHWVLLLSKVALLDARCAIE